MTMELLELVEQVAAGGQEQMDALVHCVQPRLRAYILRCTLNEDLTEDILQETMLQLLVSLKSLKNRERFWPWLYKIASNKIVSHFRREQYRTCVKFSSMEDYALESALQDPSHDEDDKPVVRELFELVLESMKSLSTTQRSVLSLRCFDGLAYQEIAEAVGCSENVARVQFMRARKKLKSALTRQGMSRKAVLPSLILFGKLTAGDSALAATITPATVTLETGLTVPQVLGAMAQACAKTAAMVVVTGSVIVSGYAGWTRLHPHPYPPRQAVQSVHYTVQGIGLVEEDKVTVRPAARSRKGDVDVGPYYCKGAYEQRLKFPEGPDGPVFVRMQRWGMDTKTQERTGKLCGWLQNGRANYYHATGFPDGSTKIYITNDPIGMLILPTDPPEMVEFLTQHTSYQDRIHYSYDRKTKLSKAKIDNRVPTVKNYKTEYAYNTLGEEDFEPFWPDDTGVIDQRDPMHYRGWTTFTFEGHLGSLRISGRGQIPFFYNACNAHPAWLDVRIGETLRILDTPEGGCMMDAASGRVQHYPAGTFFVGLGRPWSGIRAYDTLQRDAARDRIPFSANRVEEDATVTLTRKVGDAAYEITYFIDMSKDIVSSISFSRTGTDPINGKLTFAYAQALSDLPGVFEQPALPGTEARKTATVKPGHWLLALLENTPDRPASETALFTRY